MTVPHIFGRKCTSGMCMSHSDRRPRFRWKLELHQEDTGICIWIHSSHRLPTQWSPGCAAGEKGPDLLGREAQLGLNDIQHATAAGVQQEVLERARHRQRPRGRHAQPAHRLRSHDGHTASESSDACSAKPGNWAVFQTWQTFCPSLLAGL